MTCRLMIANWSLGRPLCWFGTCNCPHIPLLGQDRPPYYGHDGNFPVPRTLSFAHRMRLTWFRAKYPSAVVLLPSAVSRRSLLEPSEPESRPCSYLRKIKRSKTSLELMFLSSGANSLCSVKDLPQEVKEGLQIIHVQYVSPKFPS